MSTYKRNYHTKTINKGTLGEFSKVWEEYEELKDASNQNLVLMCLCEISDILGALCAVVPNMPINTDIEITSYNLNEDSILDGLYLNLFNLDSALYVNETNMYSIDIAPLFNKILHDLNELTNLYKDRLSFNSVTAFMEKTKEACNENR